MERVNGGPGQARDDGNGDDIRLPFTRILKRVHVRAGVSRSFFAKAAIRTGFHDQVVEWSDANLSKGIAGRPVICATFPLMEDAAPER